MPIILDICRSVETSLMLNFVTSLEPLSGQRISWLGLVLIGLVTLFGVDPFRLDLRKWTGCSMFLWFFFFSCLMIFACLWREEKKKSPKRTLYALSQPVLMFKINQGSKSLSISLCNTTHTYCKISCLLNVIHQFTIVDFSYLIFFFFLFFFSPSHR